MSEDTPKYTKANSLKNRIYVGIGDGMYLNECELIYEDELPELTQEQYDIWYKHSWLSEVKTGVRVGYEVIKMTIIEKEQK
jgi:hypothetical protein